MSVNPVLTLCILGILTAIPAAKAADQADLLRSIERERVRSLVAADIATATRLHADDYQLINPRGGTLTKAKYLADLASGDLDYLEWEPGRCKCGCMEIRPSSATWAR